MNEKILALTVQARDEASATFGRVDRSLAGLGGSAAAANQKFGILNSTMGKLGGYLAVGVAVGAVTGFLKDSIQAAVDEEAGIKRLDAALKANVPAWDGNATAIEKVIKGREDLAFADDDLRSSLALIVAATNDVNAAFEIQRTAMDLARFKNISLEEASTALIKVEGGHYRILQQLGITLAANATQTEALAAVQKVAGGQAEAFGNTTAGAMERANVAVKNLQDEIGARLTPAISELARGLTTLLEPQKKVNDNWTALAHAIGLITNPGSLPQVIDDVKAAARAEEEALKAAEAHAQSLIYLANVGPPAMEAVAYGSDKVELSAIRAAEGAYALTAAEAAAAQKALALLNPLSLEAAALDHVAFSAAVAARNLAAMAGASANAQNQTSRLRQFGEAGGAGISGSLESLFSNLGSQVTPFETTFTPVDPRTGKGGGGGGADKAAQAAAAAMKAAYEIAQKAGDTYYDSLHAKNQRAIDDAHKLAREKIDADHKAAQAAIAEAQRAANAQIAIARKAIDSQLADQLRLNGAPITAAEQALRATQNAQQSRDLSEALAAAQQGQGGVVDPIAVRSAEESLANFLAQQNIDSMREQQALADDQAKAAATAAQAELDAQQKASDETFAAQQAAEEVTYAARVAAEDAAYKLRQHDEDERWSRQKATFDAHIEAMENSKKATVDLAKIELLRYLQAQLAYAKSYGTDQDVAFAAADLAKASKHASGGWAGLNGPELSWLGERGPEYVVPHGGGTGGVNIAAGAIIVSGASDPQATARAIMLALQREMRRNGYSSLQPR